MSHAAALGKVTGAEMAPPPAAAGRRSAGAVCSVAIGQLDAFKLPGGLLLAAVPVRNACASHRHAATMFKSDPSAVKTYGRDTSSAPVRISQETFDEAVQENMEEFEMDGEEAVVDAVKQFELKGVDLSNIIKRVPGAEGAAAAEQHPLLVAVDRAAGLLGDAEHMDDAKVEAVAEELRQVRSLINAEEESKSVGGRCVAVLVRRGALCQRAASAAMAWWGGWKA